MSQETESQIKVQTQRILLRFTEPVLGTGINDKELHLKFIASKAEATGANPAEEVEAIDPEAELGKQTTVFMRQDGQPILMDYQIKGFFKESLKVLCKLGAVPGSYPASVAEIVDHCLFIEPRRIPLTLPPGEPVGLYTRTLRASDPRTGQVRVALATSETAPIGTELICTITLFSGKPVRSKSVKGPPSITMDDVHAALTYGEHFGLGAWRNGGFGRFTWSELKA